MVSHNKGNVPSLHDVMTDTELNVCLPDALISFRLFQGPSPTPQDMHSKHWETAVLHQLVAAMSIRQEDCKLC